MNDRNSLFDFINLSFDVIMCFWHRPVGKTKGLGRVEKNRWLRLLKLRHLEKGRAILS
jgi:hypothetical protein